MKWIVFTVLALIAYLATVIRVPAAQKVLFLIPKPPTPTATPTPTNPNVGIFWMISSRPPSSITNPFPAHVQGIYVNVDWTQIEPQKGTYNFAGVIGPYLAALPASGAYAQIAIQTGAYSSPMLQANCTSVGLNPPDCSGWLVSTDNVDGVNILASSGPNGAAHGFAACTPLIDPNPLNPTFQADWEDMVSHAAAYAATQPKIAQIMVAPMSNVGGDLSLTAFSKATGTVSSCSSTQSNYGLAWNTLMQSYGCTSGDNTCWGNKLQTAFSNLWNAYDTDFSNVKDVSLWTNGQAFPDITSSTGAILNKSLAYYPMFTYAAAHIPTGQKYFVNNEALNQTLGWQNATHTVAAGSGYGAQMACAFTDVNGNPTTGNCTGGCTGMQTAAITYGANNGATWEQIYYPDVQNCTSQLPAISAALNGP